VCAAFETATGRRCGRRAFPPARKGHIVSYAVDGKQYIANRKRLGRRQSRGQARHALPGIHNPNNGNAIFVFALPDN
jgi:hypothetical protein